MTGITRSKTGSRRLQAFSAEGKGIGLSYVIFACICCILASAYSPAVFAQAKATAPSDSGFKQAMTLYNKGATGKAIKEMEDIVRKDPGNADAYEEMGYMFLKKDDFDGALGAFRSALKINPLMRTAKTGVGLTLYEKGDLAGAESALRRALSLNPYPSRAHYVLGLVYEARKDYEKAIHEYKEGLRTYVPGKR